MKSKKLNLEGIRITSFTTSLTNENQETVKGGWPQTHQFVCGDAGPYHTHRGCGGNGSGICVYSVATCELTATNCESIINC